MFFYDEVQEKNFLGLVEEYPKATTNFQYRIACYIMSHPEIYYKVNDRTMPMEWAFNMAEGKFIEKKICFNNCPACGI